MEDWYYVHEGEHEGPITEAELQSLVSAGTITSESLVRQKGMQEWQRFEDVRGRIGRKGRQEVPTDGHGTCAECGNVFSADEMVKYGELRVCATCKPVFFQRLKEGAPLRGMMVYGGFWIRAGAKIIDWIVVGVANYLVQLIFTAAMAAMMATADQASGPPPMFFLLLMVAWLVQVGVAAGYTTFFLGRFAATPGKMACGLKVVTSDGGRVSYLRAFARHFAEILSALILAIGYIMAASDDEKRTLHDRICDTRVIKK